MAQSELSPAQRVRSWLPTSPWQLVPGLRDLKGYDRRTQLGPDLIAGLTVAAVAIPAGLGMGELVGLSPVAGLYATLLPMAAYCLFGSSRQLIVGPEGTLAALTATTVLPLALYFANAAYFTDRLTALANDDPPPRWVVFNAESVTYIDATAIDALHAIRADLDHRGITFVIARAHAPLRPILHSSGYTTREDDQLFHSVRAAVDAYQHRTPVVGLGWVQRAARAIVSGRIGAGRADSPDK